MLAKANRIVRGADYKAVVRKGSRFPAPHTLVYVRMNPDSCAVRFGFIVGKTVGSAPVRNTVRRRLKAAAYDLLPEVPAGADIVIRALPASAQASWSTLHHEISQAIHRAGTR
ncbi:ribonuclease P protein component [Gryllotalpicola ginsengisoli]|uniref:ribonuclease P protein component n=1 Tax=Gryllotalpicola ginsengisoli TaxID=444608 RepID=UPI0004019E98|nr:ribonuclease P protein component [Gryllotalpicola ginsengisoli]